MVVLGIDPGLATLGYGVIRRVGNRFTHLAHGTVTTPASMALPMRLQLLYEGVKTLIVEHTPDVVAVEELFFGRNTTTALTVGQARGVAVLACQQSALPLFEYTPMQVKLGVTGYGHADKQQVQFMIQRMLALQSIPKPDDAADALAIAVCHAQSAVLTGQFRI